MNKDRITIINKKGITKKIIKILKFLSIPKINLKILKKKNFTQKL